MSIEQFQSGRQIVLDIVRGVGRDLGQQVDDTLWRPTDGTRSTNSVLSFRADGRLLHFEISGDRLEDAARDANVRSRVRAYLRRELGKSTLA